MEMEPAGPKTIVTIEDQIACVEKEIYLLELLATHGIQARKISWIRADDELRCLRAVLDTLRNLACAHDWREVPDGKPYKVRGCSRCHAFEVYGPGGWTEME